MATVMDMVTRDAVAGDRPWQGSDFPDWLPPMLVRELRQGFQSGAFVWTFLLLQAALVLHSVSTVLATAGEYGANAIRLSGGLFWLIIMIGVGIVLPLRGLSAIAAERAGNNLDLVRLTRLSAMRIVVGKWTAIVAQAILATAAVLPYLVLRYFLGGVDVLNELWILGWLVVAAAVVAALAVYLSTRPLRERIGILLLGGFFGWSLLLAPMAGRAAGARTSAAGVAIPGNWFWLMVVALYTAVFLEAAAASIAPASANHAFFKRAIGLILAAVIAGAGLAVSQTMFLSIAVACGLPLLFLAVAAICERPVRFRRVHAVFARGGIAGRFAAAMLTPGWATGLVFVAIAGGLVAVGFVAQFKSDPVVTAAGISLMAATIVYPLPLLVALPWLQERTTLYVSVQTVSVIVFAIAALVGETSRSLAAVSLPLVAPFPLAGLLRLFLGNGFSLASGLSIAGLVVLAIVLLLVARPWIREMRQTQRLVSGGPPS